MSTERYHLYTGTVPVRWTDMDLYGMVNHSRIFTIMEEARWQWFNSLANKPKTDCVFPLVNANVNFRKKIEFPSEIIVKIFVDKPEKKSWIFYHELSTTIDQDTVYVDGMITSVAYNIKEKKAVEIPQEFLDIIYPKNQ